MDINKNITQIPLFKKEDGISVFKRTLNFLVDSFNGMALGLFSTLIIGVILEQLGMLIGKYGQLSDFGNHIMTLGGHFKSLMGVGIGVGMAFSLKFENLKLVAVGMAGGIAAYFGKGFVNVGINSNPIGNPMVIYFAVVGVYLALKYALPKKTPIDIILIPLVSGLVAYIITFVIGTPIAKFMNLLANFIQEATTYQPLLSGIVIAVFMGMFLTMPISSAAIAISIGLGGIAGGAAVVGCSVQMLGFAIMSRKDNNIGTVIGVGIGTSMLQFKNIIKKPIIWLPTIITSAIIGPLSTVVFKMQTDPIGAGMGTSGLVGQFGTFSAMGYNWDTLKLILVLQIALPIVLVWLFDIVFRKIGIIKPGDLKI